MSLLLAPSDLVPIVEQSRSKRSRTNYLESSSEPLLRQASTISRFGKRAMEACCHEESKKGDVASAGSSSFWHARLLTRKARVLPSYDKWSNAVSDVAAGPSGHQAFYGAASPTGLGSRPGSRCFPGGSRASSRQSGRSFPSDASSRSTNPEPLHGTMTWRAGQQAHFGPGAKLRQHLGHYADMALDDDAESLASTLMRENNAGSGMFKEVVGDKLYQSSLRAFRGPKTIFNQRNPHLTRRH